MHNWKFLTEPYWSTIWIWIWMIQNILYYHSKNISETTKIYLLSGYHKVIHRDYNIWKLCIVYLGIIYLADAVSELSAIFECHFLISSFLLLCWNICPSLSNFFSSFQMFIGIKIVTKNWLNHRGIEFSFTNWIAFSSISKTIFFNPLSCAKL